MKPRCILLYSGGLDSLLAGAILLKQGIDVIGLHCILPFEPTDSKPEKSRASQNAGSIGLHLEYYRCDNDFMKMVEAPPHGYGKNINPCIDCKIFFLKKARELMDREGASFIATGEVVGQRPMTQIRHTMQHIEKITDLRGILLRPLSALLLKPTIAEQEGIVDRSRLYDISGRSRTKQMELARQFELADYPSPAGGCRFTDQNFARRLRDLFDNQSSYSMNDVFLLTIGRHFRIRKDLKIIVSHNEEENNCLEKYRAVSDCMLIPKFRGPTVYVMGIPDDAELDLIGSIALRYRNKVDTINSLDVYKKMTGASLLSVENPCNEHIVKSYMI